MLDNQNPEQLVVYYLGNIVVCKQIFLQTFGLGEKFAKHCKKTDQITGTVENDTRLTNSPGKRKKKMLSFQYKTT